MWEKPPPPKAVDVFYLKKTKALHSPVAKKGHSENDYIVFVILKIKTSNGGKTPPP